MFRYLIVFGFFVLLGSCSQKVSKQFLSSIAVPEGGQIPNSFENQSPCKVKENYMPDTNHVDHTPLKHIRVNFHFMNGDGGTSNFDERTGTAFAKEVMFVANAKLERNSKMNLPSGNNTPIIPMRYRYKLTGRPGDPNDDGIYFHNDNECYGQINYGKHKNIYDKTVFERYGVMKDTVMNVFVMPYPEDSLKSKTFKKSGNGIAFGNWVKVCGWHYNATKDTTWKAGGKFTVPYGKWYAAKLMHHEIGHNLGLRHTWRSNDGCDDTPHHPNCYGQSSRPPCDKEWSNNFMDYNTHISSWSPCQIATIHWNMSPGKKSKLRNQLEPTWCTFKKEATIKINEDIVWHSAKDLEGHLEIKNGASLRLRCMVSLPKGAKIIVHPKGKLILDGATLYNDCGEQWKGIELLSTDKDMGEVVYYPGSQINDVEHAVVVE